MARREVVGEALSALELASIVLGTDQLGRDMLTRA